MHDSALRNVFHINEWGVDAETRSYDSLIFTHTAFSTTDRRHGV